MRGLVDRASGCNRDYFPPEGGRQFCLLFFSAALHHRLPFPALPWREGLFGLDSWGLSWGDLGGIGSWGDLGGSGNDFGGILGGLGPWGIFESVF